MMMFVPTVTSLTIESDNWNTLANNQYVAKVGDNITLKFKLPSNLRQNYQLSIGQRNLIHIIQFLLMP
ncbi:MAG: hypothetical protein CM15mP45_08970 [Deltaproteobacteria bacterium]|nr:MAG: hypothetical protein CM15mP45_08970 [Deltaproteobacteria bacterium]